MWRFTTPGFFSTVMITLLATAAIASEPVLEGPLAALDPWIGTWEFAGQSNDGDRPGSHAEYQPRLGGQYLEGRVFVRSNADELYQRYRTVFAWDATTAVVTRHTFDHDGSYTVSPLVVDGAVLTTEWMDGKTLIRERIEMDGEHRMRSRVSTTEDGGTAELISGTWRRVESAPIELPPAGLDGRLERFRPLLGGWEISSSRADGEPLWARTEFRPGMQGCLVDAITWFAGGQVGPHEGYFSVIIPAGAEAGRVVTFAATGEVTVGQIALSEGQPAGFEVTSDTSGGQQRQTVQPDGANAYRWQVLRRPSPAAPWTEHFSGRWLRQGPWAGQRAPIDPDRFVSSGAEVRSFTKETVIPAPVAKVYAAWTSVADWQQLWGPPSTATIELAIGGPYEWHFNGWLGSNGCQVLSYIPNRLVSFSWNAPPSQPENRLARTWVVVECEPCSEGTRVRLTHLGFGTGPAWDETKSYFDTAWGRVFEVMSSALTEASDRGSP